MKKHFNFKSVCRAALVALCLMTVGVGNIWGAWIGNCGINVNGTWYKSSSNINSGHWLEGSTSFNDLELGSINTLVLGGQYDSWDDNKKDSCSWNVNNGIWITIKKEDAQIANFRLSCFNSGKDGNNNVWKTYGKTGSCSDDNEGWSTYTLDISDYTPGHYTIKVSWTSPSSQSLSNTASFNIDPNITFDQQSGTGGTSSITATWGAAMPSITPPSHAEKKFEGYYTGKNGTGTQYYAYNGNSVHTCDFTSNPTTLYANWKTPTEYTFYYAAPSDIVADKTVKCYVNYGYDQVAGDVDMTATNKTYNNKRIYSVTVTANYESFDAIYFKPKGLPGHGSEEQAANTSYVAASEINGKIYEHGVGWQTYADDAPYTVYYVNTNNWTTPKAYAWSSDYDKSVANYSSSAAMTKTDYTYNGHDIYTITYTRGFTNVIFNDNASESAKTDNLECYANSDKLYNGSTWQAYGRDITIYVVPEAIGYTSGTTYDPSTHNTRANVKVGDDEWLASWPIFTKTSYKYKSHWIYEARVLAKYNVIKTIQFWVFSGDDKVASNSYYDCTPASQYVTSDIDGKIFVGWYTDHHQWDVYGTDVELDQQSGSAGTESVTATVGSPMPAITLPGRDGYEFGGYWTKTNGGGTQYYNSDGSSTRNWDSRTITTLYAHWTPKTYTVTLNNLEATTAGTESVTTTYDATLSAITIPTKAHYDFGGYFTEVGGAGTQLINADGSWIKDVTGYTSHDGDNPKWVLADDLTLYAKWTEHPYKIALVVAPEGAGTIDQGATIEAYYAKASDDITATASTGYSFIEWDFSKTDGANDVYNADGYNATSNPIRIKAQHDGTLTAKFTANNYTVKLENLDADEGYKGTENVSVTYNSSDSLKKNITIPQKAHYDFGGYYTGYDELNEEVTGVQLINEYGEWIASVEGYTDGDKNWLYADTLTLYAKWTEHPYKIALVVAPEGAGTIDKGDTIAAYYVKPTDLITATPANHAWKFKEWKYSENVGPANGTGNDNTVQINATRDGTLTANFEERYSIKGTMNGENWGTTHTLSNIGTNAGSKDTCYVTMTLPANTTYEFAIYDEQTTGWYRAGTDAVYDMTYTNHTNWEFGDTKRYNCGITTAGKGKYKFIFNITDKTVTVVYPTSYQVNYGASPSVGGNITVVDDDSQAVPNGGYVRSGGSVTYTAAAASGYTFVGWCGSDEYGETFNTELSWTHSSVAATSNSYAKFKSTNFVIYRTGDISDPRAAYDDVESYAGGTISDTIEFRMKVNELDYWYTLCLPFEVNAVQVWEDGAYYDIVPYWRTDGTYYTGHYILRRPVTSTNFAIEGFEGKDRWIDPESSDVLPSKNIPYIIQWHDPYFFGKYISFFGDAGQTIPIAMDNGSYASSDETVNIYGNNSMTTGTVRDAYLLDPSYGTDGAWMREELGTDRSVLPFECFILANEKTTAKYRVLRRDMADDTPTGLDTLFKKEDTVSKVLINNRIYIIRGGKMYTIQGTFVKEVE